jgi:hypothetical protein
VPDEQRRDAARQDPPQVQGIRHPGEAFIIVKADAGTYGMGIMTVRDPKELADINRARATR